MSLCNINAQTLHRRTKSMDLPEPFTCQSGFHCSSPPLCGKCFKTALLLEDIPRTRAYSATAPPVLQEDLSAPCQLALCEATRADLGTQDSFSFLHNFLSVPLRNVFFAFSLFFHLLFSLVRKIKNVQIIDFLLILVLCSIFVLPTSQASPVFAPLVNSVTTCVPFESFPIIDTYDPYGEHPVNFFYDGSLRYSDVATSVGSRNLLYFTNMSFVAESRTSSLKPAIFPLETLPGMKPFDWSNFKDPELVFPPLIYNTNPLFLGNLSEPFYAQSFDMCQETEALILMLSNTQIWPNNFKSNFPAWTSLDLHYIQMNVPTSVTVQNRSFSWTVPSSSPVVIPFNEDKLHPHMQLLRFSIKNITSSGTMFVSLHYFDGTPIYERRQTLFGINSDSSFMMAQKVSSTSVPYVFSVLEIKSRNQPFRSSMNVSLNITSKSQFLNWAAKLNITENGNNNFPLLTHLVLPNSLSCDTTPSNPLISVTSNTDYFLLSSNSSDVFNCNTSYFYERASSLEVSKLQVYNNLTYSFSNIYQHCVPLRLGTTFCFQFFALAAEIANTPCFVNGSLSTLQAVEDINANRDTVINGIRVHSPNIRTNHFLLQFPNSSLTQNCSTSETYEVYSNITFTQFRFNVTGKGKVTDWLFVNSTVQSNAVYYTLVKFTGSASFKSSDAQEPACRIVFCSSITVSDLSSLEYELNSDSTFRFSILSQQAHILAQQILPLVTSKASTSVTFAGNETLTWILIIGIFSSVLFLPFMFCICCFLCFPKLVKKAVCIPCVILDFFRHASDHNARFNQQGISNPHTQLAAYHDAEAESALSSSNPTYQP